ncbi:MAG TPA: DUF2007 domain-containing protein [Terriglobia bacterium]|nr:DUF2007 domain-containing protein [Terriglobia bacterium]
MAYCPDCLTEYQEGVAECMDCHLPLVAGSPPAAAGPNAEDAEEPEVKLVRLRDFYGPTAQLDAHLARNLLQAQGIPCMSPSEEEPILGIEALQIWVREEDAEQAAEILKAYLDSPQPEADTIEPSGD